MIGGDCAGEMAPLDLLASETGDGLLELSWTIPGPLETFLPAPPCRLAEDCLAMLTPPLGAGASISNPSKPLDVTCAPASASTASSNTAGTVWSKCDPCACDNLDALCESVCEVDVFGLIDSDATAGSSISRSNIADVDEWIDEGEDGRDRCGAECIGFPRGSIDPAGRGVGWMSEPDASEEAWCWTGGREGDEPRE